MKITNLKLYFQLIVSWCEPIFREDSMRLTSKSQQCTNYNITGKLTDFTNKQNSKISKYYNNRLILAMLSGLASSYSSSMLDRAICLLSTSVSIRMSTRMSIRRLWWEGPAGHLAVAQAGGGIARLGLQVGQGGQQQVGHNLQVRLQHLQEWMGGSYC